MKFKNKKIQSFITQKSLVKFDLDEDDKEEKHNTALGYFRRVHPITCLDIYIDESVSEPAYYRNISQAILDTGANDLIRFHINSPGGRLDGLQTILSAMWSTDAITEAHVSGACHSAASILALNCDNIYVSPVAEMLCHHVRFGTGGKVADVRSYVDHVSKLSEELFKSTYKDFLSDVEMQEILSGRELYLTSEDIITRLEYRQEVRDAEAQELVQDSSEINLQDISVGLTD